MDILLVTATEGEIAPLVARFEPGTRRSDRMTAHRHRRHDVDVLTTGVGMVATAAWCSRALVERLYDVALNFGVCGTFDRALALGTPVHITADRCCELGAENDEQFLTIQELQLIGPDEFPFRDGNVVNLAPPDNAALRALPEVSAVTVNTVHGHEQSIARVLERFAPRVESMEGAAFMYACLIHGLPFAQVRAVSNVVERRNREAWDLPAAIDRLHTTALEILDTL